MFENAINAVLSYATWKVQIAWMCLYEFLRATYGRAGVPLADRSLFEAAYKILKPQNMITFVGVYDGDKPVAADTLLLFNKECVCLVRRVSSIDGPLTRCIYAVARNRLELRERFRTLRFRWRGLARRSVWSSRFQSQLRW